HVHRHRAKPSPALRAQLLEERPDVLTPTASAHPKDSLGGWVHDNRRVAMPLLDGELIHGDDLNSAEIDWPELFFQVLSVDLLDGVPSHAQVLGDMLDWQHGAKPYNILGQTARDTGIGRQ